jgi:hypothetical protein
MQSLNVRDALQFGADIVTPKMRSRIASKGAKFTDYAYRPVEFAYEVLGIRYLTNDAKRILQSICDNKVTNVQASHGIGKSHLAGAILIPYWVFAMQGLCITTAPTERQVKQILWSEARKSYGANKSKLGGRAGELFINLNEEARAFGFTARSTDSNGFQGVHADRLLLIEDEACGISQDIDEGAESCLVGSNNRMLRIGNPLADGTPFAKACKRSHIKIPAWQHPNVAWAYRIDADGIHRIKEELRPYLFDRDSNILDRERWGQPAIAAMQAYLKSVGAIEIKGAISVEWIEEKREKYHENSAFWESRIEARFPLDAGQSIIPRRYFLMARVAFDSVDAKRWGQKLSNYPPRYGLDVGDGGDPHAIARWQGSVLWSVRSQATLGDELDSGRAAALVTSEIKSFGNGAIAVDNVGVGAGALDHLKRQGLTAKGFRWGSAPINTERFANLKAEQFWILREALEKGELAIAPLGEYEDELMEDWANTYYEELPNGKIKIEDKRITRKRLGRSPNLGDATVYAFNSKSGQPRAPMTSTY